MHMAKSKKHSKGKKKGSRGAGLASTAAVGGFAAGVLGKFIERLLTDVAEDFVLPHHHKEKHGDGHKHAPKDVAASLLAALADGGPKPVAQLLADTKAGLTPTLEALRTLREFRLINVVG